MHYRNSAISAYWTGGGPSDISFEHEQDELRALEKDARSIRIFANDFEQMVADRNKLGFFSVFKSPRITEDFCLRFQAVAMEAGLALGIGKGVKPLYFWLHRLIEYLIENQSEMFVPFDKGKGGVLLNICKASETFCSWKALEESASSRAFGAARANARHVKHAEADKREMERLVIKPAPQSIQPFISVLTDIQWRVCILRYGHGWKVARIARAMHRDRKTITEHIVRAKAHIERHRTSAKSKGTQLAEASREADSLEDELIRTIDEDKQNKTCPADQHNPTPPGPPDEK
jgi:hypothetical protein